MEAVVMEEENTPKAAASFLPLLLPAVMIAVGSIGKLLVSEGSGAYTFFNTFGNTVLALFCGIIAVGMLIFGRKKKVVDKANVDGNGCKVSEKSSWFEIVMNNWVGRALNIAISALLITAMGCLPRSIPNVSTSSRWLPTPRASRLWRKPAARCTHIWNRSG